MLELAILILIIVCLWYYRGSIKALSGLGEDHARQLVVRSSISLAKERTELLKEINTMGEIPSIESLEIRVKGGIVKNTTSE